MAKSDKVTIKLWVETGFANATHEDKFEIERDEWEELSEQQQQRYLEEVAKDHLYNHVDYGAYVEDEE